MVNDPVQPFPPAKWTNLQKRATSAARDFTKRWKRDRSGYRVDGNAVLKVTLTLTMKGDGELVGWESPTISGYEPRSHDWVTELDLDREG
jgi:hypothetical protein